MVVACLIDGNSGVQSLEFALPLVLSIRWEIKMLMAWIMLYILAVLLWTVGYKAVSMPVIYIGWACFIPGVVICSLWSSTI